MKITEARLRKIISEETKVVVEEGIATTAAHAGLDIAGFGLDFFYGMGAPFDIANATWYLAEGDYFNAGLSAISIIPLGGDLIGKGTKLANAFQAAKGVTDLAGEVKRGEIGEALAEPDVMNKITKHWGVVVDRFGEEDAAKMLHALQQGGGGGADAATQYGGGEEEDTLKNLRE